jgi:hypothetical protein
VALANGIEAEVRHFVSVVGLTYSGGVARTFAVLCRGEVARSFGAVEFTQPGRTVGKPPAVLQLDQRHPALGDLACHLLVGGAVVTVSPELGHQMVESAGVLQGGDGQGFNGLGVGVELGQHHQLVQAQVMALAYGRRHFACCHLERGANDTGLDSGHGRDLSLGYALESDQLRDGDGFFGRGQALPVVVLHQHRGHLVNRRQVVVDEDGDGG